MKIKISEKSALEDIFDPQHFATSVFRGVSRRFEILGKMAHNLKCFTILLCSISWCCWSGIIIFFHLERKRSKPREIKISRFEFPGVRRFPRCSMQSQPFSGSRVRNSRTAHLCSVCTPCTVTFYFVFNIDSILKVQMIPQRGRMLFRNSYLLHSILRPQTTAALSSPISNHIKSWVDAYEEFIGVSAVKDAQSQVMKVSYFTYYLKERSYCPSGLGRQKCIWVGRATVRCTTITKR